MSESQLDEQYHQATRQRFSEMSSRRRSPQNNGSDERPMPNLQDNQVALATMAPEDMRIVHELRLARHSVLLLHRRRFLG